MHPFEANLLAQAIMTDRIREANHQRLARELQRRDRPSTVRTAAEDAPRHSRLWSLVHFRQAYS